jgi:hypothetical protein
MLCVEVGGCTRPKRLLQTRPRRNLYSHQTTDRSQGITEASLPSLYYIPSPSRRDGKSGRSPHFPLQRTSESPLHAAGRVRRLGGEEAPSRRAHRRLLGLFNLGGSFRSAHVARPRPRLARPGQVTGAGGASGRRVPSTPRCPHAGSLGGAGGWRRGPQGEGRTRCHGFILALWAAMGADVCQAFGMQVITRPWRRTGEDRARGGLFRWGARRGRMRHCSRAPVSCVACLGQDERMGRTLGGGGRYW